MNKCKTIGIVNQKGGVGKTTTAENIGVDLVRNGKRVLLIDADPQASLTQALGYTHPDDLPITLADILKGIMVKDPLPEGAGILTHHEGVDIMPSNIRLSGLETELIDTKNREGVLRSYVDQIQHKYDYIIIDCMPSLSILTINVLAVSNSLIIPSQPHFLSAKGLDQLLHTVSKIKRQINPTLHVDGILMTMVDSRATFSKEIVGLLRNLYGKNIKVFATVIPNSIKVVEASADGQSIFSYAKNNSVARAYEQLSKEVLNLEKQNIKNRTDTVR